MSQSHMTTQSMEALMHQMETHEDSDDEYRDVFGDDDIEITDGLDNVQLQNTNLEASATDATDAARATGNEEHDVDDRMDEDDSESCFEEDGDPASDPPDPAEVRTNARRDMHKLIAKVVLKSPNDTQMIWGMAAGMADALWCLGIREGITFKHHDDRYVKAPIEIVARRLDETSVSRKVAIKLDDLSAWRSESGRAAWRKVFRINTDKKRIVRSEEEVDPTQQEPTTQTQPSIAESFPLVSHVMQMDRSKFMENLTETKALVRKVHTGKKKKDDTENTVWELVVPKLGRMSAAQKAKIKEKGMGVPSLENALVAGAVCARQTHYVDKLAEIAETMQSIAAVGEYYAQVRVALSLREAYNRNGWPVTFQNSKNKHIQEMDEAEIIESRAFMQHTRVIQIASLTDADIKDTPKFRNALAAKQRVGHILTRLAKLVGPGIALVKTGEDFSYRFWKNLSMDQLELLIACLNENQGYRLEVQDFLRSQPALELGQELFTMFCGNSGASFDDFLDLTALNPLPLAEAIRNVERQQEEKTIKATKRRKITAPPQASRSDDDNDDEENGNGNDDDNDDGAGSGDDENGNRTFADMVQEIDT